MTAVTHKTLAEALVAAQAEMPAVEKDAVNPHFKSKFTSLDHLIAKTRPVLTKHGLAITQWPTQIDGANALRTKITHVSGETDEDTMLLSLAKDDMQGLGGAITYGKRYMWAAVCAVSTDEDDDGNQASAKPAAARTNGTAKNETAATRDLSGMRNQLVALVESKGGDSTAAGEAFDTAASTEDFDAWLTFQTTHWDKQKAPFKSPVGAAS